MLNLADFFTPLNLVNFAIFFVFLVSCEIIGLTLTKVFVKKIPEFLRGAIWLLGLGLVIFTYFLSHFFIPYAWPAIGICLVFLLIPSLPVYFKQKGWQSLISFWKKSYFPLLFLLPVIPLIFIKASLPPWIWDEMAYHYISPYTLYHEGAWKLGIGFTDNLPRFLETAFIALFSLTKTYAVARFLHFSIFITALVSVYRFLKDNLGHLPALVYFALIIYHPENLLYRSLSGYIDVGGVSLVIIGLICLANFFLKNKIDSLVIAFAFWGMAAGIKYSALIPLSVSFLIVFTLLWRRKLIKRKHFPSYFLAVSLFLLMGGYWYIKNFLFTGNPLYPFFFGCKIARCTKEAVFGGWTTPFALRNLKGILQRVVYEDKRLFYFLLFSFPLGLFHFKPVVRKLALFFLVFILLEILIASQVSGYEPRYFYHWQFLSILFIVLPLVLTERIKSLFKGLFRKDAKKNS